MKIKLSELRQLVKGVIREEVQNAAPEEPTTDVNWQKIYPALKGYKNPKEQSGTYNGESFQEMTWGIGAKEYWIEFVWGLSITNDGLSFESLDNQNLKTFESLVGSLGLPTDSKSYMRKSTTKNGTPAILIMYRVGDWSKYDSNTIISTVKKIIDSMQGKAIEKK